MPRRDDAPRDLLFGLLALQHGIVTRDQLVLAFGAWTGAAGKSLADLLAGQGALDAPRRALLDAIADAHLKLHDNDPEKSLAALDVNRSTRESLANAGGTDIEATLAYVGSGSTDPDADRTASYAVGSATADGQRFRVLRPHAKGGLGAVFVALDSELNREVALKQILDRHADDPVSRSRFLVEAEITGGLEHPGIVPVYGLGTYDGGRPYYAMRFVRGDSLKEAIERFHAGTVASGAGVAGVPSARPRSAPRKDRGPADGTPATPERGLELRRLLRRFLDVCNAIDYAHSRGVLHRDIKPGNVIVGKHGETLVVDWGLAKPLGKADVAHDGERTLIPSSSSGSAETLPGQALGTPAFMSPEQAAGDLEKLGPRSEVYSLGATLYSLLTGKAPFDGDVGEVLRKVQRGEFAPPRQLDPSIDQALEAVCLKAMATNPDARYASCKGLADDVERWAADEPVTAWRDPFSRRARRWMRRHRPLVTAASAAVLVALAGLGAVLAVQRQANAALTAKNLDLDRANGALRESNRQKDAANAALAEANTKVQARFDLAREAVRSFEVSVVAEEALKEDRLRPLRDKLLGSARRFFDKLGALLQGESDAASKRVLAESYAELGELVNKIGQMPEAVEALRQAVALRRELLARPGAGAAERVALADALGLLGDRLRDTGDPVGARAAEEESVALVGPLAVAPGAGPAARAALASGLAALGTLAGEAGRGSEALVAYRRAVEVGEALLAEGSADAVIRGRVAVYHGRLGDFLEKAGDRAGALAAYRSYQERFRALVDEFPALPEFRRELAVSHNKVGEQLAMAGDAAGALAEQREFQRLCRALAAESPAVPQYRYDLVLSHNRVGDLLERVGDDAGALAEFRKGQGLNRALAAGYPAVPAYRDSLAVSLGRVGALLAKAGDDAGALAEFRERQAMYRALAAEFSAVASYRLGLSVTHNRVGRLLEMAGDTAGALAEQRRYQDLCRALAAESPAEPLYRRNLAGSHALVGDLLEKAGDTAGALAEQRRYQDLCRALAAEFPAVSSFRGDLAISHDRVGHLLTATGRPAEALAEHDRSRGLIEVLARAAPNSPDSREGLAMSLNHAGTALRDLGRTIEARERYDRAVAVAGAVVAAFPKAPNYRANLANGLRLRAWIELAAGDAAGADDDARRAVGLLERLPSRDARQWFRLASARATLAAAAGRDGSAVSAAEAQALADRAVDDLRRAAAAGYRNVSLYRNEPTLAGLRGRDDFKLLMMDAAMPAEPFAAPG